MCSLSMREQQELALPSNLKNTQDNIYETTVSGIKQEIEKDIDPGETGDQVGEPYNLLPGDNKLVYRFTYEFTAWREFLACSAGRVNPNRVQQSP